MGCPCLHAPHQSSLCFLWPGSFPCATVGPGAALPLAWPSGPGKGRSWQKGAVLSPPAHLLLQKVPKQPANQR